MLLPEVRELQCNDDKTQVSLVLRVQSELDYFEGHFPGQPILPGVVQVDWAVRMAHQYLTVKGSFSALEKVKFQSLVLPEATLTLALTWHDHKQAIAFSYQNVDRQCSSGMIVLNGA